MIDHISENTKAILLLCAPLLIGKNTPAVDILKPAEYKHLAKWLHSQAHQPADFLGDQANDLLSAYHSVIPSDRLKSLLGRGFQLSQALDMWASRSIWVMSRADAHYPQRLKNKLGEDAPAIFYACGNANLAHQGGLAVVGSRHINEELIRYTTDIGKSAVDRGQQIISGGAKGVDLSAMLGALTAGGNVIGVLADSLFKTSVMREFREGLMQNRLLLLSHVDPSASFNVGMAMQRNKYIYGLADEALVVNADLKKGGTWAGAEEQLTKYHFVFVYVRNRGESSPALMALQQMGAKPWEENADENTQTLSSPIAMDLFGHSDHLESVKEDIEFVELENDHALVALPNSPADLLFECASQLIITSIQAHPSKEKELAEQLGLLPTQVKIWLTKLIEQGRVEKKKAYYHVISNQSTLPFN